MNPTEQLQCLNSENWGDYQRYINFAKIENKKRLLKICLAKVGLIKDLEGKFTEPGWYVNNAKTEFFTEDSQLKIRFHLQRVISYTVDWESYDNAYSTDKSGWTMFPEREHTQQTVPEIYRNYTYQQETIVVDNKFIEEFNL